MPQNGPDSHPSIVQHVVTQQRYELLNQLVEGSHKPMIVLSFIWVALIIVQLTIGLDRVLQIAGYIIWALFGVQFLVEFIVSPDKVFYLKHNILTALSLVLPALRLFHLVQLIRIFQLGVATQSFTLVGVIASLNRGMRATRSLLARRGAGYVTILTILVVFVGAAGMLQFEGVAALDAAGFHEAVRQGQGLHAYGDAVWYTAMLLTTIGSAYWPITPAGRVLTFLISLYGIANLGYITASLASLFVGNDQSTKQTQADAPPSDDEGGPLAPQITGLSEQIAKLTAMLESGATPEAGGASSGG